ncbi:CoA-disulfide reductase [Ferrimonas sediminicola]|uniref:CoA-disulfide reductase n=1 Tax=Ferrimonas sediminicola TaxID=2569538 RepID=A0A4U1BJ08_9GAMM|nr:CoA-disulfide reductase [Ferrimonas sediminicola]TKB51135.1 CoA-disulfide reductase [Ferrimonas sediminicola]
MKIVIIGGEAAGMSAAAKARRTDRDAEIIVFEQSQVVSFGACGLPYFIGDSFDDSGFMAERSVAQFRESGIDLRVGHRVERLDPAKRSLLVTDLARGRSFPQPFDKLMIATGAAPVAPPIEGLDLERVFFLKTLEDGLALKPLVQSDEIRDVVVIGAGYIGLEVAEALVHQGKRVRVIERTDRVLSESFDAEIGEMIEAELREKGVKLHLGESVTALEGEAQVRQVASELGQYPADLVILATGVRPNTGFLADSGIDRLANGAIVIDPQGRTSLPDVYAAGDCATVPHRVSGRPAYLPLATSANKLGRMIGENLCGNQKVFPGTLGSAGVKVLGVEAGRTGLSEREARSLGLAYRTVVINDKNTTNYVAGQSDLRVKLVYAEEDKRLLGGQVAGGPGAVLRVDALAAAIHGGLTTEDLGMLDLVYAPPFARTWDALNVAGNVAK